MNITFKPFLRTSKPKKDGTLPVYIRITQNRKYRMISTGISLEEKYWNPVRGEVRKNNKRYKVLNTLLANQLSGIQETIFRLGADASLNDVKEALSKGTSADITFDEYASRILEKLDNNNQFWVWKQTRNALSRWKECFKNRNALIGEINTATLDKYQQYLINRKNHHNTIRKHIQSIRRIIKNAMREGLIENDPFKDFEVVKETVSNKNPLTSEQIIEISMLRLEPDSWISVTRDAFMFSFENAGIRFGDIARLKWKHIIDGRLKYSMAKTKHGKDIKLSPPALEILEKYRPAKPAPDAFIFPILKPELDYSDVRYLKRQISSKNVIVNRKLKKLAEMAGIEGNVSFHVSRHSYADYARSSKMNIYDLSKALGHSNLKTTERYIKTIDETSLDSAMEEVSRKMEQQRKKMEQLRQQKQLLST